MVKKEVKSNRGGLRAGAGKKVAGTEKVKTYSVTLEPGQADKLRDQYITLTNAIKTLL